MHRHYHRITGSCYPTRIPQPLIVLSQWVWFLVLLSRLHEHGGVTVVVITAFEWSSSSAARRPEVNRQALAGIWKLTPTLPHPLKEFTVYPKKPRIVPPEILLLLKEDGSFQQYKTTTPEIIEEEEDALSSKRRDIDQSWQQFQRKTIDHDVSLEQQRQQHQLFPWVGYIRTGKWAYLDGNLLLAADRIDSTNSNEWTVKGTPYSALSDGIVATTSTASGTTRYNAKSLPLSSLSSNNDDVLPTRLDRSKDDTLLKGRVVANYQTRLDDNPILSTSSSVTNTTTASISLDPTSRSAVGTGNKKVKFDTYLSVPGGSIHFGKFMYPKHHPSFFDQPMFQPMKMGNFALRQILGNLNAANPTDESLMIEKFQRSDFYNRTFLLTSHPLRQLSSSSNDKRGEKRWSIKYNDYVYDAPSLSKSKSNQNSPNPDATPTSAVRVLQIVFHRNNTFSTTGGLGNAAILRGKFDIIGQDKDHLWMQVIRFGFGRSVSGSVYSEGPMLSHEDVKAYWGKIRKVTTELVTNSTRASDDNDKSNALANAYDSDNDLIDFDEDPSLFRIEVEGSVLDGLGLEPMPVARFLLREIDPVGTSTLDNDDDDDDDDDDETDTLEATSAIDVRLEDDGVDWKLIDDSFQ